MVTNPSGLRIFLRVVFETLLVCGGIALAAAVAISHALVRQIGR